jgi:hypothetical protein
MMKPADRTAAAIYRAIEKLFEVFLTHSISIGPTAPAVPQAKSIGP